MVAVGAEPASHDDGHSMKLLFMGATSCSAETLARLFLLGKQLCFLDRPSVVFDNWGTIGHESPLRRFSTDGLPVQISVHTPPSRGALQYYSPYVEADLANPAFVEAFSEGLRNDSAFAEKLIAPAANYAGTTGADLRRILVTDTALRGMTFDLLRANDPELMHRVDLPEGRKHIARNFLVEASIEVTSALLMSDETSALPVADDNTYPKLLALRTSSPTYVGGVPPLAPLLGMHFARAVIPDEVLAKLEFKDIFEYRTKTKDIYDAWTVEVNRAAAKITDSEISNPIEAIQKILVTELMPKVVEYENEMASVRDRLYADLVNRVVTWELPTISAAYFTNLSHLDGLALFAEGIKSAAVAYAGFKAVVPTLTEYVTSKRGAKRKHAVSYLVGLTKK
jgi:hypothetical protein